MKLWVGVTDDDLFDFLRSRSELDEVNFWQPSGSRRFRALEPGDVFLFKLHSPRNFIVGGGVFATSSLLPCSLVWEIFGERNGAFSLETMRRDIQRYRPGKGRADPHEDYTVGCIVLQRPFYFDEADWLPVPEDFSKSIVQGKTYDTSTESGHALWEAVRTRLQGAVPGGGQTEMFSQPARLRPRLGEGAFRVLVIDGYERRCAVTGFDTLWALEVVHIRPPSAGGLHRVDNGLLLRADLARLFSLGYFTVGPDLRVRVSERLERLVDETHGEDRGESGDPEGLSGDEVPDPYLSLDGVEVWQPARQELRARREYLEWHGERVFRR